MQCFGSLLLAPDLPEQLSFHASFFARADYIHESALRRFDLALRYFIRAQPFDRVMHDSSV